MEGPKARDVRSPRNPFWSGNHTDSTWLRSSDRLPLCELRRGGVGLIFFRLPIRVKLGSRQVISHFTPRLEPYPLIVGLSVVSVRRMIIAVG